jgi:hypothetical protein
VDQPTEAERDARAFAAQYPTENVLKAIGHAERDEVTWEQVTGLFARALRAGLGSS